MPLKSLSVSLLNSSRNKASSVSMLHILTVSATVTRLKWRPPALETLPVENDSQDAADRHEPMLAVATAPIKGASAGGSGLLCLWSYHRPFMPLSVLESHTKGAVTDFFWLDTPHPDSEQSMVPSSKPGNASSAELKGNSIDESDSGLARNARIRGMSQQESGGTQSSAFDNSDRDNNKCLEKTGLGVWQHVLSVGRDGRCLLQSFPRGRER